MTPAEFAAAKDRLGCTFIWIARQCGYTKAAVRRWHNGSASVPDPVAAWLERRLAGHLDDPPARKNGRKAA
jgi:hypothetical protein